MGLSMVAAPLESVLSTASIGLGVVSMLGRWGRSGRSDRPLSSADTQCLIWSVADCKEWVGSRQAGGGVVLLDVVDIADGLLSRPRNGATMLALASGSSAVLRGRRVARPCNRDSISSWALLCGGCLGVA